MPIHVSVLPIDQLVAVSRVVTVTLSYLFFDADVDRYHNASQFLNDSSSVAIAPDHIVFSSDVGSKSVAALIDNIIERAKGARSTVIGIAICSRFVGRDTKSAAIGCP